MKKKFIKGTQITVLLHLVAWTILLGLPVYIFKRWPVGKDFFWLYYINTFISGIIFYINYLFLVPKLFYGTKKYRYYLSVIVLIGGFYFVSDYSNKLIFRYTNEKAQTEQSSGKSGKYGKDVPVRGGLLRPRPPFRVMHLYNYGFNALFLVFFSLGLRVLERNTLIEKLQKETEKEKLNSELAFLKSQISPHFFFNTLNNIYALISINPNDSQKAVLKLSKLMRYLLYESEKGDTRLSNEIDFMKNYIDLMKLRMNEKVDLSVSFPAKFEDINIPPLLFVPFIENSFKHGISYREKSFINIVMDVTHESISFRSTNSIAVTAEEEGHENSGIGLENAIKRLNLLFPEKHELKIGKSGKIFEVNLQIKLS